jgi:hypothetical protein
MAALALPRFPRAPAALPSAQPPPPDTLWSFTATWRSGYAAACKAVYTGSIPVVASATVFRRVLKLAFRRLLRAGVALADRVAGSDASDGATRSWPGCYSGHEGVLPGRSACWTSCCSRAVLGEASADTKTLAASWTGRWCAHVGRCACGACVRNRPAQLSLSVALRHFLSLGLALRHRR